jgi:hypothetical protein
MLYFLFTGLAVLVSENKDQNGQAQEATCIKTSKRINSSEEIRRCSGL